MGLKSRPEDMGNLESILEKNTDIRYSQRWHPTSVNAFESKLSSGAYRGMSREIRKNIAYSLQYLQFLQMEFEELHLHEIIATHIIKTYVISAMGIIEAIFHHIVKSKGYQKKLQWEPGEGKHTNTFRDGEGEKRYVVTVDKKLNPPVDAQMDFEYLINKVQEKKIIELTHKAYPHLKALKRIRNKVHLQIVRFENDTDYMGISFYDYLLMRYLLYSILTDPIFEQSDRTSFSFILPNKQQLQRLKDYLIAQDENENFTETGM